MFRDDANVGFLKHAGVAAGHVDRAYAAGGTTIPPHERGGITILERLIEALAARRPDQEELALEWRRGPVGASGIIVRGPHGDRLQESGQRQSQAQTGPKHSHPELVTDRIDSTLDQVTRQVCGLGSDCSCHPQGAVDARALRRRR